MWKSGLDFSFFNNNGTSGQERVKSLIQSESPKALFVIVVTIVMLASAFSAKALAAAYYISPTGSDSNSGASASPWKTFAFSISRLKAGDTLLLKNGTYSNSNSGYPYIVCGKNAFNGTASAPITIKAENERQAHIKGDGSRIAVRVSNCSHWRFEGLRISSADNAAQLNSPGSEGMYIVDSSNITVGRGLFHHNNRYCNCHLLTAHRTHNSLFEENEFYAYHRHSLSTTSANDNVIRRNYANGTCCPDITGGKASNNAAGGDEGPTVYPGNRNILENNIVEKAQCSRINSAPSLGSKDNKILGDICLNGVHGYSYYSYGNDEGAMSTGTLVENSLLVDQTHGIAQTGLRNPREWTFRNVTVIGGRGPGAGAETHKPGAPMGDCCEPFSITWENTLIVNANGGIYVDETYHPIFVTVNKSNYFNPGARAIVTGSIDAGSGFTTVDPQLGSCRVFIPGSSPMKGPGLDGKDIGANILYRYEKGVLTNKPLWNPVTGEFPHGAIVPGINDTPGSSAFDVHKRLNVNANGCSLPAGYGGGATSVPNSPGNLQVVVP